MGGIKTYDWSLLTRNSIISFIREIKHEIVGKTLTPAKFTKKIRETIRNNSIPVSVSKTYDIDTKKGKVWIAGEYRSYRDKKNKNFINIFLQFNPENKILKYSNGKFQDMCKSIADTLLHEIVHTRQYRRRNFKEISGYESTAKSNKEKNEQEYYGHPDEIDAYSFNIACELTDDYKANRREIIKHLNQDLSDDRLKKTSYKKYLTIFDDDHNHTVIKKLKKKIIYYLPYAEFGKPYKTSDWLKK